MYTNGFLSGVPVFVIRCILGRRPYTATDYVHEYDHGHMGARVHGKGTSESKCRDNYVFPAFIATWKKYDRYGFGRKYIHEVYSQAHSALAYPYILTGPSAYSAGASYFGVVRPCARAEGSE